MADLLSKAGNGLFAYSIANDSGTKVKKEYDPKAPFNKYDKMMNNELNVIKGDDDVMGVRNAAITKSAADIINALFIEKVADDDDRDDDFREYYKTNGNYNPNDRKPDYLPYAVLGSMTVGLGAYQAYKTGNPRAALDTAWKGIKKGFGKGLASGPKNILKSDRTGKIFLKAVKDAEKSVGSMEKDIARTTKSSVPAANHFNKGWGIAAGAGVLGALGYMGMKNSGQNDGRNNGRNKRASDLIDEMYKEASDKGKLFAQKLLNIDTTKWTHGAEQAVKKPSATVSTAKDLIDNAVNEVKQIEQTAPGAVAYRGSNRDFLNKLKEISPEQWDTMKKKASEFIDEMYKEARETNFGGKKNFAKVLLKEDFIQNGLRAIPYTTVPIAIGYAINKDIKNDFSPVRGKKATLNTDNRIVVDIPIEELHRNQPTEKTASAKSTIDDFVEKANKAADNVYVPRTMKEWAKEDLPRQTVRAASWALFPAAVIGLTGRNIRNMGEKINDDKELDPVEKGKARIIIETPKSNNNYDYKMASEIVDELFKQAKDEPLSETEKYYMDTIKKETDGADEKKSYKARITQNIKRKEALSKILP